MSARKVVIAVVIAIDPFASDAVTALDGQHPAVVSGAIRQGTRLYVDDPIVLAHPTLFVDSGIVPPPYEPAGQVPGAEAAPERPSGVKWQAIVTVYRDWLGRPGNVGQKPDQAEIAAELRIGKRTLVTWLRNGCGRPISGCAPIVGLDSGPDLSGASVAADVPVTWCYDAELADQCQPAGTSPWASGSRRPAD